MQVGQGQWGSHAMLFVGTKLLALYSHPSTPELNSSDLFLIGLFVQDIFKRALPQIHEPPASEPPQTGSAPGSEPHTPGHESPVAAAAAATVLELAFFLSLLLNVYVNCLLLFFTSPSASADGDEKFSSPMSSRPNSWSSHPDDTQPVAEQGSDCCLR